jgi:3-phenylpropionate/trans-cinnamate dioxygenase ferredoxin subunit
VAFVRVCSVSDIPSDTDVLGVEVDGRPLAVARDGDGGLHAVDNVCSHQYVLLSEGEVDDCTIECWLHGSRFDLRTGQPTGLPAVRPIDVFPLRLEGDDVLVDVTHPLNTAEPQGVPTGAGSPATKES